ncbi:MAG: DUF927 domain-containing protein [Enhydrobacter sp.]|nr:MAG: DUF927 domain-containing protein [Enhydrobacter sp.]
MTDRPDEETPEQRAMREFLESQEATRSVTSNGPRDRAKPAPVDQSQAAADTTQRQPRSSAQKPARRSPSAASNVVLSEFEMTPQGLIWASSDKSKAAVHVCGPFEVEAQTRDEQGENWGVLLGWNDPDGRHHEWAMPRSLLATDGREVRATLLDRGLYVSPLEPARKALMAYLSAFNPEASALSVSRGGWHAAGDQSVFVLPDEVFGAPAGERVVLQTTHAMPHAFRQAGEIAEWKAQVAKLAVGNTRLALAIAAAFAAPLVEVAGEESGGINFQGGSRLGKSTALRVAGSVWGGGGVSGYIRQWRGTANGLEGVAAQHCDALLCLDEMGQVDAREAGEVAYLLANGAGKSRAGRDGLSRTPPTWRTLFLSTGELSLADKMQEAGHRARVGQEVRLVDVPADAGAGSGMFETLHGYADGDAFARHLRDITARVYGTPIRAFLQRLTAELAVSRINFIEELKGERDEFLARHVPDQASGQVLSVAGRFALVAAAGNLATLWGLTGWPAGEAERAAGTCFKAWLDRRGSAGSGEVMAGIAQVVQFIEAHGASRFETIGEAARVDGHGRAVEVRTINRVGFKRSDETGRLQYLVLAKSWTAEVCKGQDARLIARALHDQGALLADLSKTGGKFSQTVRVPGHGPVRVYVLSSRILGDDDGAEDEATDAATDEDARRAPDSSLPLSD